MGDPDGRQSHSDDPHCCSQTLGTCGQPVTLVPSTVGDRPWGLLVEGQMESSMQCSTIEEPLGATPAMCALKCQLRIVFGQGLPLCLRAPGQGHKPRPAGPQLKAHLRMQRSPEAAGPSRTQQGVGAPPGKFGSSEREKGREMLWSPS